MKNIFLKAVFTVFILCLTNCSDDDAPYSILDDDPIINDDETPNTRGPEPCENGFAGPYPCNGIDLVSRITLSDMNASEGNDCWGWTDPETGKEYALMCTNRNTSFIDISDAENPVLIGILPTATVSSSWRDVKVYNNFAFVVSEASSHGMQVFDLTKLRDVSTPPETFSADNNFTGFGSAHNIAINENTGYAYAIGSSSFLGGPYFINIQNPLDIIDEGGYNEKGYTHDVQIVIYNGPDTDYTGREIFFGSNEDEVVIVDVTDKENPVLISDISYSNVNYTHQGWLDETHTYFFVGDETDEINVGLNTRTLIFDFTDLDAPQLHFEYSGESSAIDHNGYIKGNEFYLASYTAGLRIVDISDVENENISETAFFDSYPSNNSTSFNGAWSVYPFFESGNILISDINSGLFIVRKSEN